MAPIARAEPAAAKPATPPPMINTCQSEQPYCKIQILKLTEKSNLIMTSAHIFIQELVQVQEL